jgi:hypothetical protein
MSSIVLLMYLCKALPFSRKSDTGTADEPLLIVILVLAGAI